MKKKIKTFLKIKTNRPSTMTVATWLPVFTGYYNSIFNGSESAIESESDYSDYEFKDRHPELVEAGITKEYYAEHLWEFVDFSECFKDASESICNALPDLDHAGIILNTQFEKLVSPKYYNFSTDSINCDITFSPKKLKSYLAANLEAFTDYIKRKYTSRDGFISSYSNDVDEWLDVSEYGAHEVGSVLQFVIENEYLHDCDGAEMALYYASDCYESFYDYEFNTEGMIKKFNSSKVVA